MVDNVEGKGVSVSLERMGTQLAVRMIRDVMEEYKGRGFRRLGVTRSYMVSLVAKYNLDNEGLAELVHARIEYGGSIPRMIQFLERGLTTTEICCLYRARSDMSNGIAGTPSLKALYRFCRTFAESELDENCGISAELIEDAVQELVNSYWWVRYADQAIYLMCDTAEAHELVTVEATLELLLGKVPPELIWRGHYGNQVPLSIPASEAGPGYVKQALSERPSAVVIMKPIRKKALKRFG